MKSAKIYTCLSIVGLAAAIASLILSGVRDVPAGGDGELITKERLEWEIMRFRDPATGKIPGGIRNAELQYVRSLAPRGKGALVESMLSADWQRRGPFFVGGRTRALGIDVANESRILAGGVSGGLWLSADGGASWTKSTTPDQVHSVSCLAQDARPGHTSTWYAGTGEFWGNSADISGDGVYKTSDGGANWTLLPSTITNKPNSWDNPFDYIWNIVTNPAATNPEGEVYAAITLGGVYRSTDGGASWKPVLAGYGNSYGYFTDVAVTSKGVLYATISQMAPNGANSQIKGIFRSVNGTKWTDITPKDMPAKYKRIVIGIAPSNEDVVYFVAETPGSGLLTHNSMGDELWHSFWKYTYLSGDGAGAGGSWENRSMNLPNPSKLRGQMNSQGSYDLVLKVKPDNPNVVFIGATSMYRSDDGFATDKFAWIGGTCPDSDCVYDWRYPNHHADLHAITFLPSNPDILFTGSDGGVHKTLDCEAERIVWISLNNGYHTTQFYTCAIDHTRVDNKEIIGGLQDNGTLSTSSEAPVSDWHEPGRGDGFYCQIPNGGGYYYISQNSIWQPKIKIFRVYKDAIGKVVTQTRIDPIGGRDFIWNTPFTLDPNNPDIMYLAGGEILWRNSALSSIPNVKSLDSTSIGWDSLPGTRTPGTKISAVSVSKSPANVVYYGTQSGRIYRVDNANTGSPTAVNVTSAYMQGGNVGSISIDPDDAMKVVVAFTNYNVKSLFLTTDGGANWTNISGNLEEYDSGIGAGPATLWVETVRVPNGKVYLCGTSAGLFSTSSLNGEQTAWTQESPLGIGNMVIDMIDSRDADGFTAIATHGAGMFEGYVRDVHSMPQPTTLEYPANAARGIADTVTLRWKPSEGAIFYNVELALDQEFTKIINTIKGARTNSALAEHLIPGYIKYYWRVVAINSGGVSESSEIREFTTTLSSPELISPANAAVDAETDITLRWEPRPGATSYRVKVAEGLSAANTILDTAGIIGTELRLPNLKGKTRYMWAVAASDNVSESAFSAYYSFRTKPVNSVFDLYGANGNSRIYPNPASRGEFTFECELTGFGVARIELVEPRGSIVWSAERACSPGAFKEVISTRGLAPGAYIARILVNGVQKGVSLVQVSE